MNPSYTAPAARVDWADYAKGFCIIMVVMMHSTLGVEEAVGRTGFMHALVMFAKPFRMPDFFLISGLFLNRVIDRDWRTYLDRKVVHFAYFYVLWVTLQFAVKAPHFAAANGWPYVAEQYGLAFIDPFGTLWFIYLLPIFFVVTKAVRNVPPLLVWLVAAALQIAQIDTGWIAIDEFAGRFVYFYTGYLLAARVFALAAAVQANSMPAALALAAWAVLNGALVFAGFAGMPVLSLALGLVGAAAVVCLSALMAKAKLFDPVRYCGQHSIVIYLAFFLPMAATRALLVQSGIIPDIGTMSVLITAAGVMGALAIWWAARHTRANFLFERPDFFRIAPRPHGRWRRPSRAPRIIRNTGGPGALCDPAATSAAAIGRCHSASNTPHCRHAGNSTSPHKGDHVFLVDGSSYIFRAYFQSMNQDAEAQLSDGLQLNAAVRMLLQHAVEAAHARRNRRSVQPISASCSTSRNTRSATSSIPTTRRIGRTHPKTSFRNLL